MKADKKPWQSLNRKERKQWVRRLQSQDPGLEVVHAQAAGIDVGNEAHYVAVRPDRDPEPVRRFECFTADLYRLADWLQSCGVKTVAMQSTGVYWIPLYDVRHGPGGPDAAHHWSAQAIIGVGRTPHGRSPVVETCPRHELRGSDVVLWGPVHFDSTRSGPVLIASRPIRVRLVEETFLRNGATFGKRYVRTLKTRDANSSQDGLDSTRSQI
jgi:hypothetical protein